MSSRYSFSAPERGWSGSASGPVGFGVWKVPCSSQKSCQRASISLASSAVYRNGGVSFGVVSLTALTFASSGSRVGGGLRQGTKKPLTQEGPPCGRARAPPARPGKEQDNPGNTAPCNTSA